MDEINEYTLGEFLKKIQKTFLFLLKNWPKIFVVALLFGILGIGFRWYRGVFYKASMSFVAENSSGDKLGGYASIAAQFGIDLGQSGGGAFEGENLLEVFRSRKLIVVTLLSPILANDNSKLFIEEYLQSHKINKGWENKPELKNINFRNADIPDRKRDSVLSKVYEEIVKGSLVVEKKDKKLNFISLEMEDCNEFFAKRFSEELSNNAIKYYTAYKTKKAKANVDLLQFQTDSLKGLLTGSITEAALVSDLNVNPIKQILRSNTQKKQIDIQANTAMYTEVLKQLAIAKITLQRETPLIQIIDNPVLPLKKSNFGYLVTAILFSSIGTFLFIAILIVKKRISLSSQTS